MPEYSIKNKDNGWTFSSSAAVCIKKSFLGITWWSFVCWFQHDFHPQYLDDPIFQAALKDFVEDPHRSSYADDYWAKQFDSIAREYRAIEREKKNLILGQRTTDYSDALRIARKLMEESSSA